MTQTAQHTPGPWEDISYSEHAGFLIKTNGRWNPDMPGDKALMIAAPELLEALETALVALRREYDECSDSIKDAVAAIAKAEGRSATTQGELLPDPDNTNNDRAGWAAAHSPTPWLQNGKAIYYRLDCGLTENIATVHGGEFGNPHPNAAFIVRAVNNYADLLDALQFCDMTLADLETSERKGYIAEAKKQARAAIAKATA
jgi:hypothetical protein